MVVEGEVVGRDDVDTGVLLDLPVGETEPLALGEQVVLRDLLGPVRLIGLLEVPEGTHAPFSQPSVARPSTHPGSTRTYGKPRTED